MSRDHLPAGDVPNFLVIGAAKSGTYALYTHFARHPEIFMSAVKEPHYFAFGGDAGYVPANGHRPVHEWIHAENDYLRLFAGRGAAKLAGECSVSYLYWPGTAARIRRFNEAMKLIVSLRNPVDRAYSSFNYARGYGIEPLKTFSAGLQAEPERIRRDQSLLLRYRDLGLYSRQLESYYEIFPNRQIKVILHDDLVADPTGTFNAMFEFLGVTTNVDVNPHVRVNVTRRPDHQNPLHRFVTDEHFGRAAVRKILPTRTRQRLRDVTRNVLFKPPPPLAWDQRRHLQDLFRDDIYRLERLLRRDLTMWLT